MANPANSAISDLRPKPLSIDEVWDRVDPLGADLNADPGQASIAILPYFMLGGPRFERLIYELLHAENQRPWFFGRIGQAQYGVDIVTESSGEQKVYQCKNYSAVPSWPQIRDAIGKFESEWLNDMSLPAPREFVYCCSQALDDRSLLVKWQRFKNAFQKRTGVALSFWDRNAIDARLRRLPDLVAGLFSDSYAEHFCGRDEWRDDPWIRVQQGPARFLVINRFLDRHNHDAIYISEPQEKRFLIALEQSSTVALRGLPGMGKSFLALELSCRLRQPLRRIYYATLKDATSVERLWQSARRRLSLPSVFVLDDCHLASHVVGTLLERLDPELRSGKLKLVLSIRDQVGGAIDRRDDTPTWLAQLIEEQAIIDLRPDVERTLAVTCQLRPDFAGLSGSRLERIHHTCGGDLLLLDETLRNLNAAQDIDGLDMSRVLPSVRTRYFGGNHRLPTLARLAALAQFDLLPRADFFEGQWDPREQAAVDPLMTRLFAPPRYQFLHSSLATLVLRALAQLDTNDDALNDNVEAITISTVCNYLLHLSALSDAGEFALAVGQFLRAQLHLWSDSSEERIRSAVLSDKAIQAVIEANLAGQSFTNLAHCVRWLTNAEDPAKAHYEELILQRFAILFDATEIKEDTIGISTVATGLSVLRKFAPATHLTVVREHSSEAFIRLVVANGTLIELFNVLKSTTREFRITLLNQLTSYQAGTLIDKTIKAGRSIRTLGLAMRELGDADPEMLARLESAVSAPGFFRLIFANGTLFELFMILEYATPEFRSHLLDQFTSQQAETLVDKTIASARSIGTLNLRMRALGTADLETLARLESAVSAPGFLRLILANGTLFDLFRILEKATRGFRTTLLNQLTSAQAGTLIDKTISAGRSIGTLHLAMREVGDADPEILARLESAVSAPGFRRLILANGTLFELFMILKYASPGFRSHLLDQFTSQQAETLVDKTIASARSIGTLNLGMRALRDADPKLLARLERVVGAPSFLRLILANGTLAELFYVLGDATPEFRIALLHQLTVEQAVTLVDKTIAKAQGIENLHFPLRRLGSTLNHLTRLEELLGVEGWWKLVTACGTLNSLSQITQAMSGGFRARMISAASNLSVADWSGVIARGLFLNACNFATSDLPSYSEVARDAFRTALTLTATPLATQASWFDLNPSRPPDEVANEGIILRSALRVRLGTVQLTDLFELDFREAVNAVACCWRERSDLRHELGQNIRRILRSREAWPREKGEGAALRLILSIARSLEFPETEVRWLLSEIAAFLDPQVCEDMHTLPLFLFVWNIGALSYDRELVPNLGSAFSHDTQELLISALIDRVSPSGPNQEILSQLALGGLLAFLFPYQKSRITESLALLNKRTTRWLVKLAMDQTFLPALFVLEGIALRTDRQRIFTPSTCLELLKKFENYQDVGPAMNAVRLRASAANL